MKRRLEWREGVVTVKLRRPDICWGAIEAVAQIEGRSLDFNELIRCQNLKAISGISAVGVPDSVRQD